MNFVFKIKFFGKVFKLGPLRPVTKNMALHCSCFFLEYCNRMD